MIVGLLGVLLVEMTASLRRWPLSNLARALQPQRRTVRLTFSCHRKWTPRTTWAKRLRFFPCSRFWIWISRYSTTVWYPASPHPPCWITRRGLSLFVAKNILVPAQRLLPAPFQTLQGVVHQRNHAEQPDGFRLQRTGEANKEGTTHHNAHCNIYIYIYTYTYTIG